MTPLRKTCPVEDCEATLTRDDQYRCPEGHDLAGREGQNAGRDVR